MRRWGGKGDFAFERDWRGLARGLGGKDEEYCSGIRR